MLVEDTREWVKSSAGAAALSVAVRGGPPPDPAEVAASTAAALAGLDTLLMAEPARLTRDEQAALDDADALREAVGLPPVRR
jgi:hypothetical protein